MAATSSGTKVGAGDLAVAELVVEGGQEGSSAAKEQAVGRGEWDQLCMYHP